MHLMNCSKIAKEYFHAIPIVSVYDFQFLNAVKPKAICTADRVGNVFQIKDFFVLV